MTILVTGAAGFIGFHVTKALLARGEKVIGIDNLNDYYAVSLKNDRLAQLVSHSGFAFHKVDISDREAMEAVLTPLSAEITGIVHLAAQAGVRYSLENPYAYIQSNVMGQVVLFELARHMPHLKHIAYASSSSVYGANTKVPFAIEDRVDSPISLYAATKKSGEMLAYTYAHLYQLPLTGMRFFTVYGPWGRPDMAYFLFADAIQAGRPIKLFNHGDMRRDFTYIDDIVKGILAILDHPPTGSLPHRVFNLGNNKVEQLSDFISVIEKAMGKKALLEPMPMQPGDLALTAADIEATREAVGFEPTVSITEGLPRFVEWYVEYHRDVDKKYA